MFERYTERARRSIFFARYEASQYGSEYIEPEHLLLGILREDRTIQTTLPEGAWQQIQGAVAATHAHREKISTSVDLPLSAPTKRALGLGAEEAGLLRHQEIDSDHLLLGLLRLTPSVAVELLQPHGIGYESVKAQAGTRRTPSPQPQPEATPEPVHPLGAFVSEASKHLEWLRESDAAGKLKFGPYTRHEAIGHLVDYATAHHQWIARAMVEPRVVAAGYPAEDRVAAQNYAKVSWRRLVRTWTGLNHLLAHVIAQVPAEKLQTPCRIGVDGDVPLATLIERYVAYTQDMVARILTRGDS
jgi:hypothetical protein